MGWTYLCWIPAAIISGINPDWSGVTILHLAGGAGPFLAAIVFVLMNRCLKDFLVKVVYVRDFRLRGWLLVLSPVFIVILSSLITFGRINVSREFIEAGLLYPLILLFFGPVPEELGWRGVLFENLCMVSFWKAQIITACVWLIWHIPLFFIQGTYQFGLGFLTEGFFIWCSLLIVQSLIMGCIYILTNRSIASAILFHFSVNLIGELLVDSNTSKLISLCFYIAVTAILIPLTRKFQKRKASIASLPK